MALAMGSHAQSYELFGSDEPLEVTIDMPLRPVIIKAADNPVVEGRIRFTDSDGDAVSIDMSMTTRGRSRLTYCKFPPLKMNLNRAQASGTLFDGQNKLKIVTHCRNGTLHLYYLQHEFEIYKAYNRLTDFSYRVRWAKITYHDSEGRRRDQVHDAFFIESTAGLAARLGRERIKENKIASARLDPVASSKYALFQFLIGNTDWSMTKGPAEEDCCHNGKVLGKPGSSLNLAVVPYDFDQAGLINTRYAMPAERLRLRSVRQRLYRGRCRHNGQLDATIVLFNARRKQLESHLASVKLPKRQQKTALKYIDDFYKVVNNPKKKQRQLDEACVGA